MQLEMTKEQKRELTGRIAKWMGKTLSASGTNEIYWDSFKRDTESRPLPNYLTSRDDWALVEEEIAKRNLWEKYIHSLCKILSGDHYNVFLSWDAWLVRRASPLVCAQAWDEIR